jgi:hypothetical protein
MIRRQILEDLDGIGGVTGWRRVRGDGNCYYRAFMVGWLDHHLGTSSWQHMKSQVLSDLEVTSLCWGGGWVLCTTEQPSKRQEFARMLHHLKMHGE